MRTVFIYALVDPRDFSVRYIGRTVTPKVRLASHICRGHQGPHLMNWMRSLLRTGNKPKMLIIEEVLEDSWKERERFWISHYRDMGFDLTNASNGGDGCTGYKPTMEARILQSMATKGKPKPEGFGAKISAAKTGMKMSEEQRKRLSIACMGRPSPFFGKHHSPESKKKLSAARLGVPSGRKWSGKKVWGPHLPRGWLRGERHGRAKLKRCEAEEVLRLVNNGISGTLVSKMFRVDSKTVYDIQSGKNWKELNRAGLI